MTDHAGLKRVARSSPGRWIPVQSVDDRADAHRIAHYIRSSYGPGYGTSLHHNHGPLTLWVRYTTEEQS